MPAHYLDTRVPTCVRALYSGCYVVTPLIIRLGAGLRLGLAYKLKLHLSLLF